MKIQDFYCNIIENTVRLFVPLDLRKKIFNLIHNMTNSGSVRSQKLTRERFVMPNIKKDIKNWSQQCIFC